MKLRPISTQAQTSKQQDDYFECITDCHIDDEPCNERCVNTLKKPYNPKIYEHPWNKHMIKWDAEKELEKRFKKPNPPSKESIERAKFVDKTYQWSGSDSVRAGNERSSK